MYKLGYLDDDKGNRTSFARQFEKDFDLHVVEDLNEVKSLEDFLTSSSCHPKFFVKEFSYFLMPCHQHGLGVNLLVQR